MDSSTSSLNVPKLRYRVVSFPAHSAGYPATELEGNKNTRGWQSIKNPDYPIEIGLMFENVSHIQKIQFLSHQYKISSSLDILVGNLAPPFDINKINAEEEYKRAQFKLLGFMHLDDNSNTGYRARELKSVSVSAIGLFLKVILHKNHENKHNESNQVGLVAINVFGEPVQFKSDPSLPLPESFKNNGNAGTTNILKQNLHPNSVPNEEIARPIKNEPVINFPEQRSYPKVSEHPEISLPQSQSETNSPEGLREKKEDFKVSNISSIDDDDDSDDEEQDKEEDVDDDDEEEENTETVSNETESNESEIDAMKQIKQILQAENSHKKEVPSHSHNLREQINPSQQQQPPPLPQQPQANYIPQHFQHQPSDPVNPLTSQPNVQQIEPKNIATRQPNQVREDVRPNTTNNNTQPFDLLSWLRSVYLEQYYEVMSEQGYDNPMILGMIGEDDMDILGIVKPGHRKTFMRAINLFNSANAPPTTSTLPSTNTNNNNSNNNANNANIYNMKPQAVPPFNKQEDTRMSQNIPHVSYTLNSRPSTAQQYVTQFPHPIQKYNNPYAPLQVNSNPRVGVYGGNVNSNAGIARYQNRESRAIIDLSMDAPTTHISSYTHQNHQNYPPQKHTPMYSRHEQDDDVEPVRNINRPPIRYESDPHQSYQEESYRPTQMNNRNISQPQDYKDYSSAYSSKSSSPSPPPRVFHNPSDERPLPAISKTSFQDLTSASNQSINSEGENKRNFPPRESREREKANKNNNNNNNNESQEDERPRSVVGPNGELPPPSPLSDQKRAEATPLLNIWDETIITCLYSRTWALRQKALENINEWLKAGGDDESDGEQVFKACCTILSKCLEDKYPQIYLASLSLLGTLLTHYSPLANIPTHITRSSISNLLHPIVSKLGDSNTRIKDTSSDSLSEMAQLLPNMLGPYQIGHSLTRPVKSQAQYRPVLGRLLLLKKLIVEHGVGSNGSDEVLELDETCSFISAAFESPNSEVRGKAVEVLVEVYKLKEKRAVQVMNEIKSKPLKDLIANEFAKIDPDKSVAKPTKGESSSSGTSSKKKGGEPENKKKLDRENNPREGGNIKNSSDESIESPKNSCQFCGESSPRFAVQEHLDLHYMQLCPVLCECECGQVVEIQSLNEHKLQECSERKNYRTCKNCKAAISHKEIGSHQKECLQNVTPRTVFDICPLCYNYSKSLTSKKQWITHLLHCPSNTRLPPPPSNSNKGSKPKK